MSAVRDRIRSHVADHPGVHFYAVVRDLDLAAGQVQYHLRRLLTDEALVADSYYGRTHYFPPEYDAWERAALALARRETARDVVFFLLDEGPSAPATNRASKVRSVRVDAFRSVHVASASAVAV